jgi:hypothetical protein
MTVTINKIYGIIAEFQFRLLKLEPRRTSVRDEANILMYIFVFPSVRPSTNLCARLLVTLLIKVTLGHYNTQPCRAAACVIGEGHGGGVLHTIQYVCYADCQ